MEFMQIGNVCLDLADIYALEKEVVQNPGCLLKVDNSGCIVEEDPTVPLTLIKTKVYFKSRVGADREYLEFTWTREEFELLQAKITPRTPVQILNENGGV